MKLILIQVFLFFLLGPFSFSLALTYRHAPNNGFTKLEKSSPEAQNLLHKFNTGAGEAYRAEQLAPLAPEDFWRLKNVPEHVLSQARELVQQGKVVVVDSVVGNATRLGNPPGGKGAVEIAHGITFLDAKVIRLAVDSAFLGRAIPHILWTSEENLSAVEKLLNTMEERLLGHPELSSEIKSALRFFFAQKPIVLMAQADLLPVVDAQGRLSEERYRNRGAGEMVPTLFASGAAQEVGLQQDSILVFSNIDFDVDYLQVVAASLWANRPDLMQVHVPTQASGGSAYWLTEGEQKRIVPLEGIEVPEEVLVQAKTLNSNTVVMQGKALQAQLYQDLPLPFEKKEYDGKVLYLPKLSLSDIGKHPEVRTSVALGTVDEYFFTGSKNLELLAQGGPKEIEKRIARWNQRAHSSGDLNEKFCVRPLLE